MPASVLSMTLADPSSSPPLLISSSRWWSKDTVAVVTGANKGIGYALVKKFAELGLTVVLTARDSSKGLKAVETLLLGQHGRHEQQQQQEEGGGVHFCRLDVSDPASIQSFISWFKERFKSLDILVNNAAVSFNDIHENSVQHAETVMNTNFYGAKLLIEGLLPLFRVSASSTTTSRVLNISSRLGHFDKLRNQKIKEMLLDEESLSEAKIEGMVRFFLESVKRGTWKSHGWPEQWTDYAVSKLAVNAYSKVLAKRYEGRGLSVNCFCPGFTQTSMTGGKGTHTAEDAAEVGANLALLPRDQLPTGKFYIARTNLVCSKL